MGDSVVPSTTGLCCCKCELVEEKKKKRVDNQSVWHIHSAAFQVQIINLSHASTCSATESPVMSERRQPHGSTEVSAQDLQQCAILRVDWASLSAKCNLIGMEGFGALSPTKISTKPPLQNQAFQVFAFPLTSAD